jgi:hypothetical protein
MAEVKSKNGVSIRLTMERWFHITEEHSEMAGCYFEALETIREPDAVYEGTHGELLAVKEVEPAGRHMVVVYRELSDEDGFVITAFFTSRIARIERRAKKWPQ